jgi:hypothetical protein
MKTKSIALLLLIFSLTFCKREANIVTGYYDSMHFVRIGGGGKEFYINPTESSDKLLTTVVNWYTRDTITQFYLDLNENTSPCFTSLNDAMNDKIQINGDFHQTSLPSGTWVNIYLIKEGSQTEVTNVQLRNSLLSFESLVEERLK